MVLDVMNILSIIKSNELCSNCIVLENGTCIKTNSSNTESMLLEVESYLSLLKPGTIDFSSRPINKGNNIIEYNVPNVFNITNTSKMKNKSNTYIGILGRNQLLKDLTSPSVYVIIKNYEIVDDITDYKLPRFREF